MCCETALGSWQLPAPLLIDFHLGMARGLTQLHVQYADRLPIGLESIIRNVGAATVKAFYQRWYRPEHMAIFCMGDFEDPDAVVQQMQAALGHVQCSSDQEPEPLPR